MKTGDDVFYRLAPFIRDFIYRNGWTELRAVQVEACRVIFETESHLLLSSGTASGKTEAAFLPILTRIVEDPPASIGVLYIAPLKALINDQFLRLNDLLAEAAVPVWHWHGDVPASHKQKMLARPSGVLQITPESMESMLLNKNRDLVRLFGDLRYIVIDEVHAFMGTDRGIQVLCELERLQRYIRTKPRRVGLSATLGDCGLAEKWLASGTDIPVITPDVKAGSQKFRISVEHFYEPSDDADNNDKKQPEQPSPVILLQGSEGAVQETVDTASDEKTADGNGNYLKASPYWEYIYEKSLGRKCIIFTNLRDQAETVIAMLRQIADMRGMPDIYHVHHGSISAALREMAETDMKEQPGPTVIGATVSLEMGIDVGKLERIIQMDAPNTVSSFLQRLGRSGRRGNPAEMWFVCREEKPSGLPMLPYQIPWRLLQAIAVIQLYVKERWIEPPRESVSPLSMLYHQTMSVVGSLGEISPPALAKRVLEMSAFRGISQDDYRDLLHNMIALDHLQMTEERGLIIGLEGEKIINNFKFYAVFPDVDEYTVQDESRLIGQIEVPPPVGERMTLAGRSWEVQSVDMKQRTVFVTALKGKIKTYWDGGGMKTHNRVLHYIKNILESDEDYKYLQDGARKRLFEARFVAGNTRLCEYSVLELGGKTLCILPWMGSVDYQTLMILIRRLAGRTFNIKSIGGQPPYFIVVRLGSGSASEFLDALKTALSENIDLDALFSADDALELKRNYESKLPKYDIYVPPALLKKALIKDYMDLKSIRAEVAGWRCAGITEQKQV